MKTIVISLLIRIHQHSPHEKAESLYAYQTSVLKFNIFIVKIDIFDPFIRL